MELINELRDTFISNIDHQDWMDSKTKKYAKEKVGHETIRDSTNSSWIVQDTQTVCHHVLLYFQAAAIRQNIGYPEYLKNQSKLKARFNDVSKVWFCFRLVLSY